MIAIWWWFNALKFKNSTVYNPKMDQFFFRSSLTQNELLEHTRVCLTRQYTIWSDIGRRMSESVSVEDRFIKCATYVSDIPFGVEGSCMMMAWICQHFFHGSSHIPRFGSLRLKHLCKISKSGMNFLNEFSRWSVYTTNHSISSVRCFHSFTIKMRENIKKRV